MAKKAQPGDVNKAHEIRELIRKYPDISATEVISTLAGKGITILPTQFYFNKGKLSGSKGRRKKARQMVANVSATMSSDGPPKASDVVATILKVKHLASEVGGLRKLKELVESLG